MRPQPIIIARPVTLATEGPHKDQHAQGPYSSYPLFTTKRSSVAIRRNEDIWTVINRNNHTPFSLKHASNEHFDYGCHVFFGRDAMFPEGYAKITATSRTTFGTTPEETLANALDDIVKSVQNHQLILLDATPDVCSMPRYTTFSQLDLEELAVRYRAIPATNAYPDPFAYQAEILAQR